MLNIYNIVAEWYSPRIHPQSSLTHCRVLASLVLMCITVTIIAIVVAGITYMPELASQFIWGSIWVALLVIPVNVILRLIRLYSHVHRANVSWWRRSLQFLFPEGFNFGTIYLLFSILVSASLIGTLLVLPILLLLTNSSKSGEHFFQFKS